MKKLLTALFLSIMMIGVSVPASATPVLTAFISSVDTAGGWRGTATMTLLSMEHIPGFEWAHVRLHSWGAEYSDSVLICCTSTYEDYGPVKTVYRVPPGVPVTMYHATSTEIVTFLSSYISAGTTWSYAHLKSTGCAEYYSNPHYCDSQYDATYLNQYRTLSKRSK